MALSPKFDWKNTPQIKILEDMIDGTIETEFFGNGKFVFRDIGRPEVLNILRHKYAELGWNASINGRDFVISYGEVLNENTHWR